MLVRIITGAVAFVVFLGAVLLSNTVVFPIALGIVTVICLFEMFKCMGLEKKLYLTVPLYLFGAGAPSYIRYNPLGDIKAFAVIAFTFSALYLVYLFSVTVWSHGNLRFSDSLTMFAMATYIIAAIDCIMYIRFFVQGGEYLYFLIFIGAWMTDIGAYFTGVFFGKHKLIEDVSPKKTVEGSIGGIFICVISYFVFGWVVFGIGNMNIAFFVVTAVIISVVSQIGDLIMSVVKRHYGIKDFGKIFPGHGGMLDRFDSISAVSVTLGAIFMFASLLGISFI